MKRARVKFNARNRTTVPFVKLLRLSSLLWIRVTRRSLGHVACLQIYTTHYSSALSSPCIVLSNVQPYHFSFQICGVSNIVRSFGFYLTILWFWTKILGDVAKKCNRQTLVFLRSASACRYSVATAGEVIVQIVQYNSVAVQDFLLYGKTTKEQDTPQRSRRGSSSRGSGWDCVGWRTKNVCRETWSCWQLCFTARARCAENHGAQHCNAPKGLILTNSPYIMP